MIYENISSNKQLNINQILFLHIYDYEEEHEPTRAMRNGDFWELLYTEKGLVDISTPSCIYTLSKTELFFRRPSETLCIHMPTAIPAKLISIGFTCAVSDTSCATADITSSHAKSEALSETSIPASVIPIGPSERRLLQQVITEAASCHCGAPFAAGQAAILYLQLLLIMLIRNANADITLTPALRSQQLTNDEDLFRDIINYMEEHIADHLTIEQICRDNLIGRALLQKLFTEYTGCGIIDYFSLMKINTAKQLIRKGTLNFSQIAEQLGYNSIHYFSRQFKTITGTTPSEYAANLLL